MGACVFERTSYTHTVPSYNPTHSTDECCGCQSRHMTPQCTEHENSGHDGFLSEKRHSMPPPCFMKSNEP